MVREDIGAAVIRRRQHRGRNVLLADGQFGAFFEAYLQHARTWATDLDGLIEVMMRQGLAALSLHLANRPRDETVGMTLNFRQPPLNLFLTGDAAELAVTGRAFVGNVRTAEQSRCFVQTSRPRGEPTQSTIEIHGLDVLEIFEQYYARSEQHPARFFELHSDAFLMVLAFPGADPDWIASLTLDEARGLLDDASSIDTRTVRFHCGCNPDRMISAMKSIFPDNPDELFEGEPQLETFCPRCGRRWWIKRESF